MGKLSSFLDSLYMVLYPPPIHMLGVKATLRKISAKSPNPGVDDPRFITKGRSGGQSDHFFRFSVYVFLIIYIHLIAIGAIIKDS